LEDNRRKNKDKLITKMTKSLLKIETTFVSIQDNVT